MVSRASRAERVQNLMCIKRLLIGRTSWLVAGGWCPPPSSPWMMSNEPHHLGHQLGSDSISQAGHRAHTFTPQPHTPRPPLCWCWVNVWPAAQSGQQRPAAGRGNSAVIMLQWATGAQTGHRDGGYRQRVQRVQRIQSRGTEYHYRAELRCAPASLPPVS